MTMHCMQNEVHTCSLKLCTYSVLDDQSQVTGSSPMHYVVPTVTTVKVCRSVKVDFLAGSKGQGIVGHSIYGQTKTKVWLHKVGQLVKARNG